MNTENNITEKFIKSLEENSDESILYCSFETSARDAFKKMFNIELKELIPLYSNWDGQKKDTEGLFFDFMNHSSGTIVWHYRLLSFQEIIDNYNFIQSYTKGKISEDLIPFAKSIQEFGDNGSVGFAIHIKTKQIFKIHYYEYDRFVTVYEFSESKINEDFNEFLINQMNWREIGINKNATNMR